MRLTPINYNADEPTDCSMYTADLVGYGLREGCSDSDYHIAIRLEQIRKIAITFAEALLASGQYVSDEDLALLDVMREEKIEKRLARL